jgi:hypothetical protein
VSLSPGFDVDPTNESDGMSEAESLIEQDDCEEADGDDVRSRTGMLLTSVAEAGTGGRSKVGAADPETPSGSSAAASEYRDKYGW